MIMFIIALPVSIWRRRKRERKIDEWSLADVKSIECKLLLAYKIKEDGREREREREREKENNCCCTYVVHHNRTEGLTKITEARKKR